MSNLELILKKYKEFEIITPLSERRLISFEEPFTDYEFKNYTVEGNILNLIRDDQVTAKLSYNGEFLSGNDIRGGSCEIHPIDKDYKKFKEEFKTNRVFSGNPDETDLDKSPFLDQIVILSENDYKGFNVVRPRGRLFPLVDEAFKKGAAYVFVMELNVPLSAIKLLKNLCEMYYKDNIGSIQLHTNIAEEGSQLNELKYTNTEPSCFAISSDVWVRIREKMSSRYQNFHAAFKKELNTKKYLRLTTRVSRVNLIDNNDPRRKNFIIVN